MVDLARAVRVYDEMYGSQGSLHGMLGGCGSLLPYRGVREVLPCPELVPCLAAAVLVAVLGFDTGVPGATDDSASSSRGAAGGSSAGGRGSSGVPLRGGSRGRRQGLQVQDSFQGPAGTASSSGASSNAGRHQAGSSSIGSRTSSTSSSGRLANGISLDSLTPLSRGLFSLLGVEQDVVLQAVKGCRLVVKRVRRLRVRAVATPDQSVLCWAGASREYWATL
jgi:hypothetical protein